MSTHRPQLRDFAIDVTGRLARAVVDIQDQDTKQFCTALTSELWLISERLKAEESITSDLEEPLFNLLEKLEKLCKSFYRYQSRESEKSVDSKYPSLTQLQLDNYKPALKVIRRKASDRSPKGMQRRRDLIQILQKFSHSLTPHVDVPGPKLDCEVDEFSSSIQALYNALSSYCICTADGDKAIIAKLRLAIERKEEDHNPAFGVIFLAHPHDEDHDTPPWWQDTKICVDLRTVRFEEKTDECVRLMVTDFCERISRKQLFQLSLIASSNQLQFKEMCKGDKRWVQDSPSVSLATILGNRELTKRKMKYLLSYLLAKSVWQFYSTAWMGKEWTKENVQFMFERRRDAGIFLNEPFISARFDPIEPRDDSRLPHKFPKIRTLGIMLLEIELGTVIEDHIPPKDIAIADADLNTALELIDHPYQLDDTPPRLKTVISECLRPEKFMRCRNDDSVRKALQEHVVDQLYTLTVATYGHPDNIALLPISPSNLQQRANRALIIPHDASPLTAHVSNMLSNRQLPPGRSAMTTSITESRSQDWFNELDKLKEILSSIKGETDNSSKRVRVAVLDTGVKADDFYAKHIKGYKDFVSDIDSDKKDNTGHGTNSVKLIFKVFANAEVYVARVFENEEANQNTQDLMAQAIQHASENWEVDIISMPSGFETDHDPMRDAIDNATANKILIFAAASNYGNIRPITFPGRMRNVICMFCTDGRAKISPSINPAPNKKKPYNFAIIGENVTIPPSTADRVSGTSVATCIAAGLAGQLLDFSRHSDSTTQYDTDRMQLFNLAAPQPRSRLLSDQIVCPHYAAVLPRYAVLPHYARHSPPPDMDPLSVTASIISVLQLSAKVLAYLNDVKDASKDRTQCATEISNISGLLSNLRDRVEEGDVKEPWYTEFGALAAENGPLDKFN
ncbi:hypothetical protein DL768_009423 [Monosporascus sp. mg162]|nr:hypothetical protein DL768_009423 [Monosporascus sp. mg162]